MPSKPRHHHAILPLPFGTLGICSNRQFITRIDFLPPDTRALMCEDPLIKHLEAQLRAYLKYRHHRFILPLAPTGTNFRNRVWAAIRDIPAGQTRTYGDIARALNTAPRAIGQACGDNPYPIVIPCHRVLASNHIGGFAHDTRGFLLDVKRWLLAHEGLR